MTVSEGSLQVVVGTHGTLKNFMGGGSRAILQYDDMRILVFDEADHMLAKDGAGDDSLRMLAQIRG